MYVQDIVKNKMTTIPYTKVRQNFKSVMQEVCDSSAPITITRQGGEAVIMISESEFNGINETAYLMRSPKNAKRLDQSIKNIEKNENLTEFDPTLA